MIFIYIFWEESGFSTVNIFSLYNKNIKMFTGGNHAIDSYSAEYYRYYGKVVRADREKEADRPPLCIIFHVHLL